VNLASRLESATKQFGAKILIGPLTYQQAKDEIVARPLGDIVVKGKVEPVSVHELLAMRRDASAEAVGLADAFARAQERARAGDVAAARAALDECERIRPGDGLAQWFRGVLDRMASGEEPTPWSGRTVLESK
jgi:adenylate cyclase